MNVFIFHGTNGSPAANWFPWLRKELETLGIEVFLPALPTPEGQNETNWLKTFEPYQKLVNEQTIFVGHSMGAVLAMRLLENRNKPILAAVLAAPFHEELHLGEDFDRLLISFIDHHFDWKKIKNNCTKFVVFEGDDDPYVPLKQPKFIAEKLAAKLVVIPRGGHLSEETGYRQFPAILEEIKRLL